MNTERVPYDPDEPSWLFPDLEAASRPAEKIGDYIKDLRPLERGGAPAYEKVAVGILPEMPTAGWLCFYSMYFHACYGIYYILYGCMPLLQEAFDQGL